jgi:predicted TIM-barrel fold metal-dependent hydrolase
MHDDPLCWSRRAFCGTLAGSLLASQVGARSARRAPRVDIHGHVTSDDARRYPPSPLDSGLAPGAFDDPLTMGKLIAAMDANGIDHAVLVQRAHVYGFDNSYVLDSVAAHPDRFRALCIVDAAAPDSETVVRDLVSRPGVVGIRMTCPSGRKDVDWFAGEQALRAWKAALDGGGSIRLHFYDWNRAKALPALERALARFPDAPVVIDHLGGSVVEGGPPDYGLDQRLQRLSRYRNVSFMFSMINQRRLAGKDWPPGPMIGRFAAEFGAERLLWGSDVGNTRGRYADMIAWGEAATATLRPADREKVLGGTAAAMYGFTRGRGA